MPSTWLSNNAAALAVPAKYVTPRQLFHTVLAISGMLLYNGHDIRLKDSQVVCSAVERIRACAPMELILASLSR